MRKQHVTENNRKLEGTLAYRVRARERKIVYRIFFYLIFGPIPGSFIFFFVYWNNLFTHEKYPTQNFGIVYLDFHLILFAIQVDESTLKLFSAFVCCKRILFFFCLGRKIMKMI